VLVLHPQPHPIHFCMSYSKYFILFTIYLLWAVPGEASNTTLIYTGYSET
jgi:hypothetical protein